MQIQYHQACSSIGTLLYIQLYVPTEYETIAGRSPNIFQAKTPSYLCLYGKCLDETLANKSKPTITYVHT